ncbi:tetratricopeptide repeat protein [Aporhodopirellula aestuarii]|uniref:Tetratricopeptide repeat protein n=1 Tax=Aporhodopirellula aestuarii TaxID=2950107 RepID=A0ABT0U7B0_9BACT|nr:tetratricopeptide repeat protein [Aporhodopirellula aestuarii]MCM2372838.1 tetratricopeptide repeat protein [Aporhodopirellula aestuarii]
MTEDEQEFDRIIADCTETLDAFPDDVIALSQRGWAWYRMRNYDSAIADFDKTLSLTPDRADVRYNRGLAFSKKREYDLAITDLTEAILRGLPPNALPDAYYTRGRCRYQKQADADAIEDYNEAIRLDPLHVKAYLMRGLAWQNLGDHRKAIADYTLAIRSDPESADAYHNRGNAWVCLGKLRKGIADFSRAIHLDPKNAVTYTSRGVAWNRRGSYAEALADYERALELDPRSAKRRAVLAEFLAICPQSRYRDGARALELITEACELTNYSDTAYLGCLAAAHAEKGDFQSAISFQRTALALATEDDDIEDMRRYIESYEAGEACRMKPPSWRERWS